MKEALTREIANLRGEMETMRRKQEALKLEVEELMLLHGGIMRLLREQRRTLMDLRALVEHLCCDTAGGRGVKAA